MTCLGKGFFDVSRQGPKLLLFPPAHCALLKRCGYSWLFRCLSSPKHRMYTPWAQFCPPPRDISKAEQNALPLRGSQSDRETANKHLLTMQCRRQRRVCTGLQGSTRPGRGKASRRCPRNWTLKEIKLGKKKWGEGCFRQTEHREEGGHGILGELLLAHCGWSLTSGISKWSLRDRKIWFYSPRQRCVVEMPKITQ